MKSERKHTRRSIAPLGGWRPGFTEAGTEGRLANGRFAPGNKVGGKFYYEVEAKFLEAFTGIVSVERFAAIVRDLYDRYWFEGEYDEQGKLVRPPTSLRMKLAIFEKFAAYLIGLPRQRVEIEGMRRGEELRLEILEQLKAMGPQE